MKLHRSTCRRLVLAVLFCGLHAANAFGDELPMMNPVQSSLSHSGAPGRALDGNKSGVWSQRSVTHTRNESEAWWSARTENLSTITDIQLWNRTDCCTARLSNFYVFVSNSPFASNDVAETLNDDSVWSTFHSGAVVGSVSFPVNTVGQYVRIQLQGNNPLSLAEVVVNGSPVDGNPVTTLPLASAEQSSTGFGGSPSRAIDGNTSGVWNQRSVTHTQREREAWWSARLDDQSDVTKIQIWNRTNCCTTRLSNFYVFISDSPFASNDVATTLADDQVWSTFHSGAVVGSVSIPVNASGRYVRIQLQGSNYLSLAEVVVFGQQGEDGPLPTNDNLTAFHRDGQTFLTWTELDQDDSYHVYRHNAPITSTNIGTASRLTSRWGALDNNTSVNPHGGPNAPANYVINDLAPALSDGTGLFVYTTQTSDSATAYYAVTRINAANNELTSDLLTHTASLNESVVPTTDVLTVSVNDGKGRLYTQFMDYTNWNPTFNGYAYNYSVALPANYNVNKSYPLLIEPHAFYEIYKFRDETEYSWEVIQMFPHDPGAQVGSTHSWWYGYSADHNYLLDGNVPAAGVIENFTEQRVMRSIDTLIAHADFNIDDKLISAYGNSMGASGALSLGMRYGSVLAGIYANEPMTNYASSPKFLENFEQIWGLKSRNLPIVNRGPHSASIQDYGVGGSMQTGVWDWMDHHQQLVRRKGDSFAYLMVSHGKADVTIDWATQGQPFVQALTDAKAAFSAVSIANEGHTWFGFVSVVRSLFGFGSDELFPWRYPVDLSFPAIHNASGSGSLNPGTTVNDRYNLNIEWATPHTPFADTIVDEAARYEISIRSLDAVQTADITPRNTRLFTPIPGETCIWNTTNNNNNSGIANGTAIPDADGLITVTGVSLSTGDGTLLTIDCD